MIFVFGPALRPIRSKAALKTLGQKKWALHELITKINHSPEKLFPHQALTYF